MEANRCVSRVRPQLRLVIGGLNGADRSRTDDGDGPPPDGGDEAEPRRDGRVITYDVPTGPNWCELADDDHRGEDDE